FERKIYSGQLSRRAPPRNRSAQKIAIDGFGIKAARSTDVRYIAMALDYDGTLATEGKVPRETLRALVRLKESGRQIVLVTGRLLEDLLEVFPEASELCERIVTE